MSLDADASPKHGTGGLLARLRRDAAPAAKQLLLGVGAFDVVRRVRPSRDLGILRYHAVCGAEGHRYAEPSICVTPDAASFENPDVRDYVSNVERAASDLAARTARDRIIKKLLEPAFS